MGIQITEIYLLTCDHCGIREWFEWQSCSDCRTLVRSKGWDISNEAVVITHSEVEEDAIATHACTWVRWHLHCSDCGPFCLTHDMFPKQLAERCP
jgi:hypothetical protein